MFFDENQSVAMKRESQLFGETRGLCLVGNPHSNPSNALANYPFHSLVFERKNVSLGELPCLGVKHSCLGSLERRVISSVGNI
jgi:hypothetical protein